MLIILHFIRKSPEAQCHQVTFLGTPISKGTVTQREPRNANPKPIALSQMR